MGGVEREAADVLDAGGQQDLQGLGGVAAQPVVGAGVDVDRRVRVGAELPCGVPDQVRGEQRPALRAQRERAVRLQDHRHVAGSDGGGRVADPGLVAGHLPVGRQPVADAVVALPRDHPEDRHLHEHLGVAPGGVRDELVDPVGDPVVRDPVPEPLRLRLEHDPVQQLALPPGRRQPRPPGHVGGAEVDAPGAPGERVVRGRDHAAGHHRGARRGGVGAREEQQGQREADEDGQGRSQERAPSLPSMDLGHRTRVGSPAVPRGGIGQPAGSRPRTLRSRDRPGAPA